MHRELKRICFFAFALAALFVACSAAIAADASMQFLTRRGDKLFDGDREFRFISFNIPNLMVIEDAYEFTRPNPWRWPNDYEIEDALESVRQMGGQVVRTYVLSVYREGSDMGECVHVRRPGEFNEEGFRALDKVIEVARRKGIRVIIPFVDQAKWWGGIGEYAAFRGKPADAFWNDPQIKGDFKATVRYLIERKNSFTGVAYRDEPAVFGWETGNEILPTPAWTREMAAYIKQLDRNHLVLDGKSLRGLPLESLDDPNIDVLTTHHYPFGEVHDFAKPIRAAHAAVKGKKPYFIGEFGFVELPRIADAIQSAIDDGTSGALLWSLRMHRREGGFYWHMEVGTGRNIYKAFHWPGFASGDRYDERAVMKLVRDKAYEIRGIKPPALERPAPPRLLPIEKVSAISWQGSAGAQSYDVWRASAAAGPWKKIATDVSDADVQYRPLFNDGSAIPGQQYWYRIVARNVAGDSEPSNFFGPVTVESRTLVDECRDLSLLASSQGQVSSSSENARTVQEDCHRLRMARGSSIVYCVEKPTSSFRILAFGAETSSLTTSTSSDGKNYQPVKNDRAAFLSSQTVYGYATPIEFKGDVLNKDATYLRIEYVGSGDDDAKSNPIEISRIEIEYDRNPNWSNSARSQTRKPTQFSAAVFVDGAHPLNDALKSIDAAARRGEKQANIVVTILVDLTEDLRINSFGDVAEPRGEFKPFDNTMRENLKEKLRQVFARMAEHGMAIYVLPHIDAGGNIKQWRNWVDFDPLEPYSGYAYADLLLGTIADAIQEAAPNAHVELALSGEMGTSLFRYPESYRTVVRQLRARPQLRQLKIGISLNHGGIAGRGNPTGTKDLLVSDEKREQMQGLINDCDFIGMSFYAPVSTSPTPDDFVRGINRFIGEFKQYGLSVPTDKPMQFSEVGIGGGRLQRGETATVAKAVESPWEGTAFPRNNPWRDKSLQKLRRQYYDALLQFLATQPARYRVSAAFGWSMGSWDPIGLGQPEFADPEITAAIATHNRSVLTP
jgi:hypothetical protein